jgi:hypothetical protein
MIRKLELAGAPICGIKIAANQYMEAGHPDLLICFMGHMLFLECKVPSKDAKPLQEHQMGRWTRAGATSRVVRSVQDVEALLAGVPI